MLDCLRVTNIAIVEEATLEPGQNFTTITGETGSGKSVLMGSLKLALGERSSTDVIRSGAKKAVVEATFSDLSPAIAQWLADANLLGDDGECLVSGLSSALVVRRELSAAGQSRAYVNDHPVPLTQLRELAAQLIDIHGQHDSAALFSAAHQLRLLDNYGDYRPLIEAFQTLRGQYRAIVAQIEKLTAETEFAERQKGYLEFQIAEIDAAAPAEDEEASLETERKRLANAEAILSICAAVTEALYAGDQLEMPAAALVAIAEKQLGELVRLDSTMEELREKAAEIRYAVEDLAQRTRSYADDINCDPQRLEAVVERVSVLRGLKKKYGADIGEVLAHRDKCAAELQGILSQDEQIAALRNALAPLEEKLVAAAAKLSRARAKNAQAFGELVTQEMRQLNLPQATLDIVLTANAAPPHELPAHGAEDCEFHVVINLGESPKPLRKVASGGEISRIMLAIKCVLADKDDIQTLVFDEIDTGISGDAASKVADKLATLGRARQVIAITHLPQIAVRGDKHIVIEKQERDARTHVTIAPHTGRQRTVTIATMIVGHPPDDETIAYAQTLLDKTQTL